MQKGDNRVCLYTPLSSSVKFPSPLGPMTPTNILNAVKAFTQQSHTTYHSYLFETPGIHTFKGRYAIFHAAAQIKQTTGRNTFLAPAYHCPTMIEPLIRVGFNVVFYGLSKALEPNLEDIFNQRADAIGGILLCHFFGKVYNFNAIKQWADQHGVMTIEDCSHTPASQDRLNMPGGGADYATFSTAKFFPIEHGGFLCSPKGHPLPTLTPAPLRQELKSAKYWLDKLSLTRTPSWQTTDLVRALTTSTHEKKDKYREDATISLASEAGSSVWQREVNLSNTRAYRMVIKQAVLDHELNHRTTRYREIDKAIKNEGLSSACMALNIAPASPYVYPLLLEHPETQFTALKNAQIPIWRWEEIAQTEDSLSLKHRRQLIQVSLTL